MELKRTIHWTKLAEIQELKEFFAEDFQGFQQLIEAQIEELSKFSDEDLAKLAKLRALEVTNGCTQWGFRRGDRECLPVESTRKCMNMVMGFIKRKQLYFPSEGQIEFNEELKTFIDLGIQLYKDAFKNHVKASERQFYASSTAQFIVYGHERMGRAMALVQQDYEEMFSPYYILRGQKYIGAYLESFEEYFE
ncbi:MAG: hypothetical protein EBE86_008725 [Hormoscilla sp. GUM202]|nr:hypothetical protein [Hormoscilla sp. GUM202]